MVKRPSDPDGVSLHWIWRARIENLDFRLTAIDAPQRDAQACPIDIGADGVVLLSNAEIIQEDLVRHILRPTLPLDPTPSAITLEPEMLDRFLGDYRDDDGQVSRIQRDDRAGLVLVMPAGHKAPLTAESQTSFFVRGYAGLTVTFAIDASGKTQSLTWTLNGESTVARRISPPSQ